MFYNKLILYLIKLFYFKNLNIFFGNKLVVKTMENENYQNLQKPGFIPCFSSFSKSFIFAYFLTHSFAFFAKTSL